MNSQSVARIFELQDDLQNILYQMEKVISVHEMNPILKLVQSFITQKFQNSQIDSLDSLQHCPLIKDYKNFIKIAIDDLTIQLSGIQLNCNKLKIIYRQTPSSLWIMGSFKAYKILIKAVFTRHDSIKNNIQLAVLQEIPRNVPNKRFCDTVLRVLSQSFLQDPYPSIQEIQRLQYATGLSERQISMWFTNKRCRSKKRKVQPANVVEDDGHQSDALTHSPPNSPTQEIIPLQSNRLSFEDDYFEQSQKQADLEFFQTMFSASTSNWLDYSEFLNFDSF